MASPDDPQAAAAFYTRLMGLLRTERLPFLVGGAWSFAHFTGIRRPTKDLDIFVRQADWDRLVALAEAAGWRTELSFPHWLGKVHCGADFVDVIFNSGNGLSPVDDTWFEHAVDADVLGQPVRLAPVEESLWTKAFIMERERYDGADVAHLLHACALRIDWPRLVRRFEPHWRVLLAHLVLFGFVYPGERHRVPAAVMDALTDRLRAETRAEPTPSLLCQGTLLSREQYLPDVAHEGYEDVRLTPESSMSAADVATWTAAIAPAGPGAGPAFADDQRRGDPAARLPEERTMAHPDPNRAGSERDPRRTGADTAASDAGRQDTSPPHAGARAPQRQAADPGLAPQSGEKPEVMPPAGTARR